MRVAIKKCRSWGSIFQLLESDTNGPVGLWRGEIIQQERRPTAPSIFRVLGFSNPRHVPCGVEIYACTRGSNSRSTLMASCSWARMQWRKLAPHREKHSAWNSRRVEKLYNLISQCTTGGISSSWKDGEPTKLAKLLMHGSWEKSWAKSALPNLISNTKLWRLNLINNDFPKCKQVT